MRLSRAPVVFGVTALLAIGLWLAWLGWRTPYVVVRGETSGPWTEQEVTGLVLSWALLVVLGCWRAEAVPVVAGAVTGLTAVYVGDLGFRPDEDGQRGLIVIGATWLVVGSAGGGTILALATAGVRSLVHRLREGRSGPG